MILKVAAVGEMSKRAVPCYSDSWVANLDGWDGAKSEGWRHFGGRGRLGDG